MPDRRLDPHQPYKPLDFGNGLLAGSIAPTGRILSLSTYHPAHGYIVLSATAPFPNERRNNQAAVRAYRDALAQPDAPGFGLQIPAGAAGETEHFLRADAIPKLGWRQAGLEIEVTTWAPHLNHLPAPGAVQLWRFYNPQTQAIQCNYRWGYQLALVRASYTQLTERGPLAVPATTLQLTFDGSELAAVAPDVGVAAIILGLPAGPSWQQQGDGPLPVGFDGQLTVPPGEIIELVLIFALGGTVEQARHTATALAGINAHSSLANAVDIRQQRWRVLDSQLDKPIPRQATNLAHRAQSYILDCCALPVDDGICLLTDHQILPLSWTRDAYFLLQGLPVDWSVDLRGLLRGHLIWLFETAQRPAGYWGRAYLANGRPKDQVFQLDQQCYPLLELAEYVALTGDTPLFERLWSHLSELLETIVARRAPNAALFATEETPADDPMPLPYHFSSQILVWHTLRHLQPLNHRRPFTPLNLAELSQAIHTDTRRSLEADFEGRRLFAYATDLQGHHHFYHDANDLPTALAPLWGFCPADDPVWRATMDFAFSPANAGGYYPGSVGGLGSVHTPGAWPLGDVQELLYARMLGDTSRANRVLTRLLTTACWDGSLPEARDSGSGAVRSRHWFGWPGAALLAALTNPGWQP